MVSYVTMLSVLVLAILLFPNESCMLPAGMETITVPLFIPLTVILKVVPSLGATWEMTAVVAPAVPVRLISTAVMV